MLDSALSTPKAVPSQLAFFLDTLYDGQGIRATRLDHANNLNDGAIRVTREARRRGIPCFELPVYKSINEVVLEATAIARRKRPRPGAPTLPALALVFGIEPLRAHGHPRGAKNPRAMATGHSEAEADIPAWDLCARSYTIVLVEAVLDRPAKRGSDR